MSAHPSPCEFDRIRDTEFAHKAPGFERVLHVFNTSWHGIRAASGYAPGHKLAISDEDGLDGEALRHIQGLVHHHGITRVVFQGYSPTAADLAGLLRRDFGDALSLSVITHVTSAQFENAFEIEMQGLIADQLATGVLARAGSVKPGFAAVVSGYWPHTILNYAPRVDAPAMGFGSDPGHVFVPVENTWRKNLYTNVLAALAAQATTHIHVVNHPTGLDRIADLGRLVVQPYRKRGPLLAFMAAMEVQMNVTLAECQPMTQLEALAVGTPCLTGPLRLAEFADDPLCALTEVEAVEMPGPIAAALDRVVSERRADPDALAQMIDAHLALRTKLATERYADFLDL